MSVSRQANFLGQQRLDVPHLRALDSSVAYDFDLLAGRILAGDRSLVVRGLEMVTSGAVGSPATDLQLVVGGSVVLHYLASEHGTIFSVAADQPAEALNATNPNVEGGFTANQVNYVGLDLTRIADDSTADLVMFMDANTRLEVPKSVPLARTLKYRIIISTVDFGATPNVLPIARVTTGPTNTVTALEDARPILHRLGSGGSTPDRYNAFSWPGGRLESTTGNVFSGGDKAIGSTKDWMDAVMTRIWEIGGGQYWYSPTSDRDTKLIFGQPVIPATGDNFQWTLGSSTLQWSGLSVVFANAPVSYNTITNGSAVMADGQVLYVDLNRDAVTALTPQVGNLQTIGQSATPGNRYIIAWRQGDYIFVRDRAYEVGRPINVASNLVFGAVKLKYAAVDPVNPLVLAMQANGSFVNTADSGNAAAFLGTGNGTGAGFDGTGGATNGPGMRGRGGGTSGSGGYFTGAAAGPNAHGVRGEAGAGGGWGGRFVGSTGGGGGGGLYAEATDFGTGAEFYGGTSAGSGIQVFSRSAGSTVGIFTANVGNTNGIEVYPAGSGVGVLVTTGTNGVGAQLTASGTGRALEASATNGHAGLFTSVGTGHAVHAVAQASNASIAGWFEGPTGSGVGAGLIVSGWEALRAIGAGANGTAVNIIPHSTNGGGLTVTSTGTGAAIDINNSGSSLGIRIRIAGSFSAAEEAMRLVNGHVRFTATNPANNVGFTNSLTGANVVKAWGTVAIASATFGTTVGFNIGTPTLQGTNPRYIRVPFVNAMASAGYSVTLTARVAAQAATTVIYNVCNQTTTYFDIAAVNVGVDPSVQTDLGAGSFIVNFVVNGHQ